MLQKNVPQATYGIPDSSGWVGRSFLAIFLRGFETERRE